MSLGPTKKQIASYDGDSDPPTHLPREEMRHWQMRLWEKYIGVIDWQPCELALLMTPNLAYAADTFLHAELDACQSVMNLWNVHFPRDRPENVRHDSLNRRWFDDTQAIKAALRDPTSGLTPNADGTFFWADGVRWAVQHGADFPPEWIEEANRAAPTLMDAVGTTQQASAQTFVERPERKTLALAARIGVTNWSELEVKLGVNGLKARKAGMDAGWHPPNQWISWGDMKIKAKKGTKYFDILVAVATGGRQAAAETNEGLKKRYNSALNDLNDKMRHTFGLSGQAFSTHGSVTRSNFGALSWDVRKIVS